MITVYSAGRNQADDGGEVRYVAGMGRCPRDVGVRIAAAVGEAVAVCACVADAGVVAGTRAPACRSRQHATTNHADA